MKLIILCVLVAGLSLFQGCTGPLVNLSGNEQYKSLVGHTFRLQGDSYIYFFDDETKKIPYVSDKRSFPGGMASDYVGKTINGQVIVGSLKKGTDFRLESVWQQKVPSSYSPERYFFIISLEGVQVQWTKLNAIGLTDCNSTEFFKKQPMLPMFLSKYVEPVVMTATNSP